VTRVILDPNVLVAALISPRGAPAALYLALTRGAFELIASPQLLRELRPRPRAAEVSPLRVA
jgi:predicted nucleic acid-binding protein